MSRELNILLVEDNYEHLRLTKYILKRQNISGDVFVVRDGQEAIDYLYRRNQYADPGTSPRPDLVLLDLNIPRVNGKELLGMMKGDRLLKEIPVIVMSSSDREEEVAFARRMGAVAYISKADGFEQLTDALSAIGKYAAERRDPASDEKTTE